MAEDETKRHYSEADAPDCANCEVGRILRDHPEAVADAAVSGMEAVMDAAGIPIIDDAASPAPQMNRSGGSGPAMVNSKAYQEGWERIFSKKGPGPGDSIN